MSLKGSTNQQRSDIWKGQKRDRTFQSLNAEVFFLLPQDSNILLVSELPHAAPFAIMWRIGNPDEFAGMLKHQIYLFHNKTFLELDTKGGRLEAINFLEIVARELKDGTNKDSTTDSTNP